jgi:hypothetical protein
MMDSAIHFWRVLPFLWEAEEMSLYSRLLGIMTTLRMSPSPML